MIGQRALKLMIRGAVGADDRAIMESAARDSGRNERWPLCPTCGYNLTGLVPGRCPECGADFDSVRLYGEADAGTKAQWHRLQNVIFACLLFVLITVVAWTFCFLWLPLPIILGYATIGIIRGVSWKLSSRGLRMLSTTTPGLQIDYRRTFVTALFVYGAAVMVTTVAILFLVRTNRGL